MLTAHSLLAYFDPGSGSLVMQVIVGGAAGLIVFAKYLWDTLLSRRAGTGKQPFRADLAASSASSGEIPIDPRQ